MESWVLAVTLLSLMVITSTEAKIRFNVGAIQDHFHVGNLVKSVSAAVKDLEKDGKKSVNKAESITREVVRGVDHAAQKVDLSKIVHEGAEWLHGGRLRGTGCQCSGTTYDCGCCVHLDFPRIKLDNTGCVNITYLPHDYGISVIFSIDGVILINETISARNPPPLCFGVPYLEKEASLCLDFYNLDITNMTLSGCTKVEARLVHVVVGEADLGCFKIPLAKKFQQAKLRPNLMMEHSRTDANEFLVFYGKQKEFVEVLNMAREKKLQAMRYP